MFVETTDGSWTNLMRASRIEVRKSTRAPGTWMIVAYYSGATPVIRDGFGSDTAARQWLADLLEDVQ